MVLGHIYEIFDKRTGECIYVGSTSNHPLFRWAQHLCEAFRSVRKHGHSPVHDYMKDEGPWNFDFRVLEDCFWKEKTDLLKREQLWMDKLKPRCNVCPAYANIRWHYQMVVCECGVRLTQGRLKKHRDRTAIHARRMQEIALAKIKDGVRIHPRFLELSARPELSGATPPERAARVEAQAEAVDGAREVPRARANHPPADSETG